MKTLIAKYNYNTADSQEIKIAKSLILIIATCCSLSGLIWACIFYVVFGFGLTTALPLMFVGLVVPAIFISHFLGNYKILVHAQIICITLITALIQWSLGSIHDSGFVIAWCFLSPLGALLFLEQKQAKIWMLIFLSILAITVIVTPRFSMDGAQVTETTRILFYLINVGTPFTVIFITTRFFLKDLLSQTNRNTSLLEITKEQKQNLEEALEREKELGYLKSNFVSTASHQFRTPLTVIQSNLGLLEMLASNTNKEDIEKYKKVNGRITSAINSMTELMDEVLVLGKLTSGNIQYKPEELNMVEFCDKLVNEFNHISTGGRFVNIVLEGQPYTINLDPKLLTHALSNLISNAFKYSVGKNNPELIIHFNPKELVLSVKDYGMGIPAKELSELFQPFFRANNAAEISGTGLGLSIAKEYVEINKGHLSVKSTLGEGSCFEIKFKKNT